MADASGTLGGRAASGAVWLVGQTVFTRITGLLTQWLIANWLLSQEQIGQVALVYTITAFATQLVSPGLDEALLPRQRHLHRWLTAAFWMGLSCALLGSLLMIGSAAIVVYMAKRGHSTAYGDINLFWMAMILAAGAPLNAMSVVAFVKLRAEMRFAKLAVISVTEGLLQQIFTILLATLGCGAYSLIIPTLITSAFRCFAYWHLAGLSIRMSLSLHRWPVLAAASGWILGSRLCVAVTQQGDYATLAKIYDDKALVGRYSYAFGLSMQVVRVLTDNMTAVLMPTLYAIQDDAARLYAAIERACRAIASVVMPAAMLQILLAGPVIHLLWATKWTSAIILVQCLSFGPMFGCMAIPMGSMIAAKGKFHLSFTLWIISALAFFALVIPGALLGKDVGTAIAVSVWTWLLTVIFAAGALQPARGFFLLCRSSWRALLCVLFAALPCVVVNGVFPVGKMYDILAIFIIGPLFVSLYATIIRVLDRGSYGLMAQQLQRLPLPVFRTWFRQGAVVE